MNVSNTPTITTAVSFSGGAMSLTYTVIIPSGTVAGTYTGMENKACAACFADPVGLNSKISGPQAVVTSPAT
jgi:hypothetical protein